MSELITPFLMQSAVQAITPILIASLAGVLCSRVGVFNIALEGHMLVGAFAAIVGSYLLHSAAGGVAAAMLAAMIFSLVLAWGAAVFRGDAVVICIGMNLLASGLTAYLLRVMFGVSGTFSDPEVVGLSKIPIAWLQTIPVIGWGFGRQTLITWSAWVLVALVSVVLFLTPTGLRLRGVGEQPDAAETLGVDVRAYRIATVAVSGALTGLAGAQLSLGAVTVFAEDMSAGRGWIAVVAVMLGRANPLYATAACVLFGFADAFSVRLQSQGLPNQLTDIAPYVVTLVALAISYRKRVRVARPSAETLAAAPGSDAKPQLDAR
jgi:simple sugar transport system permease protein